MSGVHDTPRSTAGAPAGDRAARLDVLAERSAAVGVGLLIVIGFVASYTTLRDLAVHTGGFPPWMAPVVPLSFDLGIVVLSLKVVLASRAGRDARVLRGLVLLLSAATVVANGAASSTTVGRLLHAVPPAMFVVCFETLVASARHDAQARRAAARPRGPQSGGRAPFLGLARWLLAPRQAWSTWRAEVLGESSTLVAPMTTAPAPPSHGQSPSGVDTRELSVLEGASGTREGQESPGNGGDAIRPADRSPRPSGPGGPVRADAGAVRHRGRLAVAGEALQADPAMTAVALAEHLDGAGHHVSVRTAQRIKHEAHQSLGAAAAGGALSANPGEGRPG